ncbi:cation diffusion facilitator family transporter [Aquimonas voraii]|uniref:Cobalt-zinc-cadmium efflux system protein n=1 Tax=Aquimonas voraii TaxID=265719 RepID=A0A1G6V132_9GAMM|nr:cation diffusion facilitator family transporter [Aquimonas voraii]SDD47320.1 cobalt-zinc-cadmium efflux system protein [Aquimonas voraii]
MPESPPAAHLDHSKHSRHPSSGQAALLSPFEDEHHHDHGARFLHDPRRVGRLRFAFLLTLVTMVAEAVGGVISGSLALIADAGHMAVDSMALLFAFLGARFARRPADHRRSFGYARLEVLVGYTNALLQLALVAWIASEAVQRLFAPQPIQSLTMLVIAFVGLIVNLIVLKVLGGHDHDDLNAAGAYLHVLGDLLGSVAAITAALLVWSFGWLWADAVVSLLVGALLLHASISLMRRSAHILLEGVPEDLDLQQIPQAVESRVPAVRDVHHVHVWQLTGGSRVATLHAVLAPGQDPDAAIRAVRAALHQDFAIDHVTVQLDGVVCAQADCRHAHEPMQRGPVHTHSHDHDHDHNHDDGHGHGHDGGHPSSQVHDAGRAHADRQPGCDGRGH